MASLAPALALLAGPVLSADGPTSWWAAAASACLVLVLVGGLLTPKAGLAGRGLSTLGLTGFLVALGPYLLGSPTLSLVAILVVVGLVGSIWGLGGIQTLRLSRRGARELSESRARLASAFFIVEWFLAAVWFAPTGWTVPAAGAGLALASGYTVDWAVGARRRKDSHWWWPLVAGIAGIAVAAVVWRSPLGLVRGGVLLPLVVLLLSDPGERGRLRSAWWRPVVDQPARLLIITFVGLSALGTLLLLLPVSSAEEGSLTWIDAAFTAVSAVCVTGLVVVDTPVAFSAVGQAILLVLIQLGGLGIMSFSSVTLALLGLRPSLRHEAAVAGLVGSDHRGTLRAVLGTIVAFTLLAEAIGAMLLTAAFVRGGEAIAPALWRGVFTAVSAFCNAGFALQSDSLIGYRSDPAVLHVVGALIILGGLSPATVAAVRLHAQRRHMAVEHKLALLATGVLLFAGAGVFLALEWRNTLAELSVADRISNAWFQSLTTRTAGFNSVEIASVRPATLTFLMLLMFIGGSPGGTAGGVKTTTVVVLGLAIVSAIRGRWVASAFGRRISHQTVYKAASIVTLGVLSLIAAFVALQLTQLMDPGVALFEAGSALATVGLSIGGTPLLDEVGKILVMACMFAGRVGPLSLFLFLQDRRTRSSWELVEEEVSVG